MWLVAALMVGLAAPFGYRLAGDAPQATAAGVLGEMRLGGAAWSGSLAIVSCGLGGLVGYCCGRRRRSAAAAPADECRAFSPNTQSRVLEKRTQLRDIFADDVAALFSDRIEVRHLMSAAPETVPPNASAEEVAALMQRHRVRHVLVAKVYGTVQGIISDRDLRSRSGRTAGKLMTADPICVPFKAHLGEAIDLMLERNISCLPVLRGPFLCGILTTADVVLGMRCALDVLERAARELQCDTPAPPPEVAV
jgi:CBS domain-containing protein